MLSSDEMISMPVVFQVNIGHGTSGSPGCHHHNALGYYGVVTLLAVSFFQSEVWTFAGMES